MYSVAQVIHCAVEHPKHAMSHDHPCAVFFRFPTAVLPDTHVMRQHWRSPGDVCGSPAASPGSVLCLKPEPKTIALPRRYLVP